MEDLKTTILSDEIVNELKDIAKQKKALETREKELKKGIVAKAQEYKVGNLTNNGVRVQCSNSYIDMVFDSELFIAENPEIAIKYMKPTLVQGGYKVVVGGKGQ